MQVWKFNAGHPSGDVIPIQMPKGAKVLHFDGQGGTPRIWAQVDPKADHEIREFMIVGTGWDLPDTFVYIATLQDGPFVWHLYECKP